MDSRCKSLTDEWLEEADEKGYLRCPRRSSGEVVRAWIKRCQNMDWLCLYTLANNDNSEVIFRADTKVLPITFTCLDALFKLYYRYAREALVSQIDEYGFKLAGLSTHQAKRICEAILEVVRERSTTDALPLTDL